MVYEYSGIGLKTQKILEYFVHPSCVYNASDSEIKVFLTKKTMEEVSCFLKPGENRKEVQRLQEEGIFFFTENSEYPERLNNYIYTRFIIL